MGGVSVLVMVLVLGALLRLYTLGHDPLSPVEAAVWRDWGRTAYDLDGPERREILAPAYHQALHIWGDLFSTDWMFRFFSVLCALVLIVLAFRIGTVYFNPQTGGLCALLLAVSPPLVIVSQDIGPAPLAAVLLTVHFICLLGIVFRDPGQIRWAIYVLSGIAAILCHPLAAWVVLAQAVLAIVWGPREGRRGFYRRMMGYVAVFAAFTWGWFRLTQAVDPFAPTDWRVAPGVGPIGSIRLLGATVFWGTRAFPASFVATVASVILVVVPLLAGAMSIRQRQAQDVAGFLLLCGAIPPILISLLPSGIVGVKESPAEIAVLVLVPLLLWAAVSLRMGLSGTARQGVMVLLVGGGGVISLLATHADVGPDWENLRNEIEAGRRKGRAVIESGIRPLADYQHYLGLQGSGLERILRLEPGEKTVLVIKALRPPYLADKMQTVPARLLDEWLKQNAESNAVAEGKGAFSLTEWSGVDPGAIRKEINEKTFLNDPAWKPLLFVSGFSPYAPGFDAPGTSRKVLKSKQDKNPGRTLSGPRTEWNFPSRIPPDYYHVYIPLSYSAKKSPALQPLIWTLPNGERRKQMVGASTKGFSFLWEPLGPGDSLKIGLSAPGYFWRPKERDYASESAPLRILGIGLRRHFPYTVDVGAPFDDLSLGDGWHQPESAGEELNWRATRAVAEVTMHIPMAGGIGMLEGELTMRVRHEHPEKVPLLPFSVEWDDKPTTGATLAKPEWQSIKIKLPAAPGPGSHTIRIKSQVYKLPSTDDSGRSSRYGILVDRISLK